MSCFYVMKYSMAKNETEYGRTGYSKEMESIMFSISFHNGFRLFFIVLNAFVLLLSPLAVDFVHEKCCSYCCI